MLPALALVLAVLLPLPQSSPTFRDWNKPVEPFRVAGPLYYVGTENITSLLITTPQGHVLIDGGLEETAPLIIANVRKLGFRIEDVRILLSTHAHTDHAGGLAQLKAASRARLYAGMPDLELLARGGRGDFAFDDTLPFPPVKADVGVRDGQEITVGDLRVRAVATPGHTKGCTTWTFTIDDNGVPRRVVMIGGTSAPSYRLVGNAKYPGIAADFESTFRTLRSLQADIVFEGHGFAFDLEARRLGKRPFVDPTALRESVDKAEGAFRKQLREQGEHAVEVKAIASVKNALVRDIDPTLPRSSLGDWLAKLVDGATTTWEVNDCGEQTGNPDIDRGRDIPMCVEAEVTLTPNRHLNLMFAVGTFTKGLTAGPPHFFSGVISEDKRPSKSIGKLRDLPAALKAAKNPSGRWFESTLGHPRRRTPVSLGRNSSIRSTQLVPGTTCLSLASSFCFR